MEVRNIGIAGGGKMGQGIALSAVMAGYHVTIHDLTETELLKAITGIDKQIERLIDKQLISETQSAELKNRIMVTDSFVGFDRADLVIESVTELLDVKRVVFGRLDSICKKEAVIVTNTSTFSITELAAATNRQEQVAGMHFFLQPSRLVEITRGKHTSDSTVKLVWIVAESMNKICIELKKDSPGFIANRIYTPLLLEAFRAYESGIASKEDIDLAMRSTYLPIGPFELADIIGLDVIESSLEYYKSKLGPSWNPPRSLKELVKAGRLGKKSGKGWYDY